MARVRRGMMRSQPGTIFIRDPGDHARPRTTGCRFPKKNANNYDASCERSALLGGTTG